MDYHTQAKAEQRATHGHGKKERRLRAEKRKEKSEEKKAAQTTLLHRRSMPSILQTVNSPTTPHLPSTVDPRSSPPLPIFDATPTSLASNFSD
jgi:hypothetical protein